MVLKQKVQDLVYTIIKDEVLFVYVWGWILLVCVPVGFHSLQKWPEITVEICAVVLTFQYLVVDHHDECPSKFYIFGNKVFTSFQVSDKNPDFAYGYCKLYLYLMSNFLLFRWVAVT